jgi:methylthioribose-1-phosphate isomerase
MRTIEWHDGKVTTIDQTKLPSESIILEMHTCKEIAEAINTMKIRGAPLLGAAAAYALALTAYYSKARNREELIDELDEAARTIRTTRPTAVNLFWAIDQILKKAKESKGSPQELAALIVEEAQRIADQDVQANREIGKYGATLIKKGDIILTHCNAGALATCDFGTALGVVRTAWNQGKKIKVFATETRPLLQGARLTTYELKREGIPVTLITDNMVGYVMQKGLIDEVIVGADRIVQDAVINKIGTFTVAVLAKEHAVPFYVAAPTSTLDLMHKSSDVLIEERKPEEVTHIAGHRVATEGVKVMNPSFDITPLKYVSAIITETGILYKRNFRNLRLSIPRTNGH